MSRPVVPPGDQTFSLFLVVVGFFLSNKTSKPKCQVLAAQVPFTPLNETRHQNNDKFLALRNLKKRWFVWEL